MADTSIEWSDKTWNPVTGCTRASAGCDNCYAVKMTQRLAGYGNKKYLGLVNEGKKHFNGVVRCHEDTLSIPFGWAKPQRIFVNSMSDLFHKDVPFEFVAKAWFVMLLCPQHTFQVLTKRPDRMAEFFRWHGEEQASPDAALAQMELFQMVTEALGPVKVQALLNAARWPLPNVWIGTSVEDQKAADERIPHLLKCPAAVRFLSCEPLLGLVDLTNLDGMKVYGPMFAEMLRVIPDMKQSDTPFALRINALTGHSIQEFADDFATKGLDVGGHRVSMPTLEVEGPKVDWVICGGESGPNARPLHPEWARSLRDQCVAAGVPYFFKQWGQWGDGSTPNHENAIVLLNGEYCVHGDAAVYEAFVKDHRHDWNDQHPCLVSKVGKKAAGRVLDGRTWDEFPEVAHG